MADVGESNEAHGSDPVWLVQTISDHCFFSCAASGLVLSNCEQRDGLVMPSDGPIVLRKPLRFIDVFPIYFQRIFVEFLINF